VFLFTFVCWPREAIWNPFVPGKCLDQMKLLMLSSVLNFVSDLIIIALPQIAIARLMTLSLARKVGIAAVFATGAL
jgi:hypothetical protein